MCGSSPRRLAARAASPRHLSARACLAAPPNHPCGLTSLPRHPCVPGPPPLHRPRRPCVPVRATQPPVRPHRTTQPPVRSLPTLNPAVCVTPALRPKGSASVLPITRRDRPLCLSLYNKLSAVSPQPCSSASCVPVLTPPCLNRGLRRLRRLRGLPPTALPQTYPPGPCYSLRSL